MTANLLEDMSQVLGSGGFGWMGRAAGESPDVMDRAASVGLPALLGGLSSLGDTPAGAGQIMNLVHGDGLDEPNALARLGAMGGGEANALVEQGKMPLGAIFGNKLEGVVDELGGATHVKRSTMSRVLSMLTPIALAVIGKKVREDHLDADGLSSLLQSQHAFLAGVLPASLASTLGLGSLAPRAYSVPVVERPIVERPIVERPLPVRPIATVERRTSVWPWLALAAIGALGALLLYRYSGTRHAATAEVTTEVVTPPNAEVLPPPPEVVVPPPVVPLPPAAAPEMAAPAKLDAASLATPDLRFAPASAALPTSMSSLDGVASAMSSNPGVQIRVIGHTDSREHDDALATQRAEAVKGALVARGVPSDRIEVGTAPAVAAENAKASANPNDRRVDIEQVER